MPIPRDSDSCRFIDEPNGSGVTCHTVDYLVIGESADRRDVLEKPKLDDALVISCSTENYALYLTFFIAAFDLERE